MSFQVEEKVLTITLDNIGKRYNREWIFRYLSRTITPGEKLVVLGGNGSGKSTLLQLICGFISPTEGKLVYTAQSGKIYGEEALKDLVSFASPYLQLIEDFTAPELITHLALYKPFRPELNSDDILEIAQLRDAQHKQIRFYSSGMKQRLKLALAILADTPVLLLDEPLSNLDKQATGWYKKMIDSYGSERTVIVCSNAITDEYAFCSSELNVSDFKKTAVP